MLNLVISQNNRNSFEICFDIHHENMNGNIFGGAKDFVKGVFTRKSGSNKVFNMENIRYKKLELFWKSLL